MNSTFVVYIDESGDEGFSFERGSSKWFVLSSIIIRKNKELQTVKLVDGIRRLLGKPELKPLHFRDLKHEQRLPFIAEIARSDVRTVSVLVHKPSIKEPEKFRDRYRLYFYSVRYLLERVSWYCRDHTTAHDSGDGSAEVVFSNRSGMSYEELRNYVDLLKQKSALDDVRIAWEVIKPDQISAFTAGRRMGLQIADAVASALFYAVEQTKYGFTEDKYARMLEPTMYHRQKNILGYGLKFWPRETHALLEDKEKFGWIFEP